MVLTGPLVYLAMLPNIIILVVGCLCTGFYNRRAQVSRAMLHCQLMANIESPSWINTDFIN